ncbi:MAG: hypothetical protein JW739_05970 [Opitutales bacterium]|nr:hypothetical protein [Opitutales bacterium]
MSEKSQAKLNAFCHARMSKNVEVGTAEKGILLKLSGEKPYIEASPHELSLPDSWDKVSSLEIEVASGEAPFSGHISLHGHHSKLELKIDLEPEKSTIIRIPLEELPLIGSIQDPYRIDLIRISAVKESELNLKELTLAVESKLKHKACIDKYGQRIKGTWPHKQPLENGPDQSLPQTPYPVGNFHGWNGGVKFNPSGFFKLGKTSSGRWWLIDPEGLPFWSFGVGKMGLDIPENETLFGGREDLFKDGDNLASNLKINFYKSNVLAKEDTEAWAPKQIERIKAWGLNTIGMHSDIAQFANASIPFVLSLPVNTLKDSCNADNWPDIFDPDWMEWFQEAIPEKVVQWSEHANLLGFYFGTPLPWNNARFLDAEPQSGMKQAWMDFISDRYKEISSFNETWKTSFASWSEVLTMTELNVPKGVAEVINDKEAFLLVYAEQFFSLISTIVTSVNEKHLLLGPAFGPKPPHDDILKIAGNYMDVICWNTGSTPVDTVLLTKVHELTNRPILLCGGKRLRSGEHRLPSIEDSFPEKEAVAQLEKDIEEAVKLPFVLGYHLDALIDAPISGRMTDGSSESCGLLDIADSPYIEMVAMLRKAATTLYEKRLKI